MTAHDLAPDEGVLPLDVPEAVGIRLDEFQVPNWGTFDKRVQRLSPRGGNALLTGQVGAGKSTLVDGLTTLFAPTNRVTFNQAAGASRGERSLTSYMLGYYRSVYDEETGSHRSSALRSAKNSYTVLLARFSGLGKHGGDMLTAGAVFWFGDGGGTTAHRLYFLADRDLDIGDHLSGHPDAKAVRSALRDLGATYFDNNFRVYQRALCRRLNISDSALELLVQTISMKQVGDLTDFVRRHMLDRAPVEDRIVKILAHYADLIRAHELVLEARAQLDLLVPVGDQAATFDRAQSRIDAGNVAAWAVPRRIELLRRDLIDTAIRTVENQLPGLIAAAKQAKQRKGALDDERAQLKAAISTSGGAQLSEARHLVEEATRVLRDVRAAVDELTTLDGKVGLDAPESTGDFARFRGDLSRLIAELAEEDEKLRREDFRAQSLLHEA